ncbi:MAG TPA: ribonuclease H-like domain-containing protein, partial [candidate division Zixibacteria bacterium]|nr:ribonuclease H-like domain-containing protein [candidate division Zixibacteria bacterium]
LEDYENLVTFNGKGYDIPILNGRFILQRIKPNFESQSHLDLLFPSRRFWKKRLKNCSLLNLEREILGIERVMDIPGYLIPQVYFDYLKDGKAEQLKLVLEHNRYDILAMVGLLAQLGKILQEPEKLEILHSEDWVCLSRHYFYAGDLARAKTCGEKAVQKNSRDEIYTELNLHLGRIYKKLAEWDKAEKLWHNLLIENSGFRLEPYLELAKLYEHKLKDYGKAMNLVEKAISNVNASLSRNLDIEGLYYRKQRLLRKIELSS